jgi:hypothetical protein
MPYGYKSGYEGYVRTILEAGAASLRLVEERPRHRFREYLIGRGALHFKMAAECETDAVKSAAFLRRSLTLLDGLKNSKDDLVRSAARYYLHAFRAGKNIYQNADIWSSGWYSLF